MTAESSRARGRPAARRSVFDTIDTSTPVLVLAASPRAGRSPHGGLGILRSLGRLGIPVYTVDSNPRGPSSHSRYVRRRFLFDLAGASPEASVEHVLRVGRYLGRRAVLIPTWDDLSILVADAYPALSEHFLLPRQPDGLARSLASKKEMHRLALAHGVPTPQASFPASIDDVRAFAADATFPVMIKGIFGNRLHERAGRTLFIAERPEDLLRLYGEIEDPADPNLMLQEYIPGGDDAVWMFNGYFDADSECLFGLTGRKLRQTPAYAGTTSLGICLRNEAVDTMTRRWMKALGYRGILDIGYRFDARDGEYKVLDVNPRIGGTFRLFEGRHGLDVARALYLDLTGQPVPADEMVEGRKWLDEHDVASSLRYRRDGKLTLRQWATSLRGVQETIYLARDDPAPFVSLGPYALRGALGRIRASSSNGTGRVPARPDEHTPRSRARQHRVDRLFESTARDWKTIYEEQTVYGLIHQERQATTLDWIDGLRLPDGAPVLEIGCGAGLTAVALAERGLSVTAIDSVPAMIGLTEQLAHDRDLAGRIRTLVADTQELPLPGESYSLVLALGVLPWLHSPDRALEEMVRVVRPGGYVLVNVDNVLRLHYLLDPLLNPAFASLRRSLGSGLRRSRILHSPAPTPARLDTARRFDAVMERLRLDKMRSATIGFGPFTFWRRPVFSESNGMRLHRVLQDLADRGVLPVRSTSAQYLVLARKRGVVESGSEEAIGRP